MSLQTYDVLTGEPGDLRLPDGTPPPIPPLLGGWAGPEGPAIEPRAWPRSPRSGAPLFHAFTLWLPEDYRRRDPQLVAVSVFQWQDQSCGWQPIGPDIPAAEGEATARTTVMSDDVGSYLGLMWLTEAELTGPRTARPEHGELVDGELGKMRISSPKQTGRLWLCPNDDPNAGIAFEADPGPGSAYQQPEGDFGPFWGKPHLGGTVRAISPPQELSPWYLEVTPLGGLSYGDDDEVFVDLEASTFRF